MGNESYCHQGTAASRPELDRQRHDVPLSRHLVGDIFDFSYLPDF
jgi:hypothetical protein